MSEEKSKPDCYEEIGKGALAISMNAAPDSPTILIKDDYITINASEPGVGVRIDNSMVTMQGLINYSAKGTNIVKGNYSENDFSSKIFTYTETVLEESVPKEVSAKVIGQTRGLNEPGAEVGVLPLVTDMGIGTINPHFHTIITKHVHKVEPSYLYRVPKILIELKDSIDAFMDFINV